MKINLFRIYIFSFIMLSDFVMFAQPGDDDDNGDLEGDDPPQAPINGKLLWLLIAGLVFAYYTYKSHKKAKTI